jgi:uncharacterized protein YeaC (DUF1315 family)
MPLRAKIVSKMSAELESQIAYAVEEGKVPQAVVFAASKDGTFRR